MANITVLTRQDLESMVEGYRLGRLLEYAALEGGLANSSFKIDTEAGAYVLSVCDEKKMDEIVQLCGVLRHLEEHDFPTTRVIETRNGDPCISYKEKPVYLKSYIDGLVIEVLADRQLHQVGALLARLHEIPPHPGLLQRFSYGVECFDELGNVASAAPFYRWLCDCRKRIVEACSDSLPRGFVHGDLFADNMLFVDGDLAALLDFEEACSYYKVFDIGMSAIGCCSSGGSFSLERAAALVKGYQSVRQLEPDERRSLQAHAAYAAAATAFWRYRQYHVRNPEPGMENHYQAMAALTDQVSAIDPERFVRLIFDLHER